MNGTTKQENMTMQRTSAMFEGRERDVVEMDGQLWLDTGKDMVPYVPKSVEIVARGEKVQFTEDKPYNNYFGVAVPWAILDNKMVVVYERLDKSLDGVVVGQKVEYPIQAQADTVVNAKRDFLAKMKKLGIRVFGGASEAFTLGVIAKHGYISVQVPPKFHESYPEEYEALTGESPEAHLGHGYLEVKNEAWWAPTHRLNLPVAVREVVSDLKIPAEHFHVSDERIEVADGGFVRGLFKVGFRIGKNEGNIERIRAKLSGSEQKAFDDGVQYAVAA